MTSAIHIASWRTVDPVEASKICRDGRTPSDPRQPEFLCTICLTGMHLVKPADIERSPHFSHFDHSNCEAVFRNRLVYRHLQAVDPVNEQTIRLRRAQFLSAWPFIFQRMREIIPLLSYHEFIECAQRADQIGIWKYRNFDLRQIPYNFSLIKDFLPEDGLRQRPEHIRFWIVPSCIGRYWMWPQIPGILIRGHFHPGAFNRTVPSRYLLSSHLVDTAIDPLASSTPQLRGNLTSAIERRLREIGYEV